MFIRAGFNPRCVRRLAFARIHMLKGSGRVHPVELVRFACGDIGWYCARRGFVAWPECVGIVNFIQAPLCAWRAPVSLLSEAPQPRSD